MKQILLLLFAFTFFSFELNGQTEKEKTISRIENYLIEMEKIGFKGAVLVELDGEKIISKGYGFANQEKKIKNTPETIFDIGSITKQFTATAILKLEIQGKLSTNDKITKYFSNVPDDKKNISIHDLLRHQSGLKSNVGGDYEKIIEEEFLDKVMQSTLKFPVGTKFAYSNIGYSLLAMIIEKVSGQSYETYLYENLWKPAEMEMTGYTRPAFNNNTIAIGYDREDKFWGKPTEKEWDKTAPYWHLKGNGGILSTTEDMYKWHRALMSEKILTKETKQKLYHPQIRAEENKNSIYAYGWDVSKTDRNTTLVWHNGSNRIFYADFLRFIDEGTALIMLSNKSHPYFDVLNREISDIIFKENYIPEIPVEDNEANRSLTNHLIKTIEESGLEKAKEEYRTKSKNAKPLEFLLRNTGFDYIDNDKPDVAMQLFELNVFIHPNSAKALQGLGEGYMETGNKKSALIYFNRSLAIKPDNPFVKNMMKRMEE